MKTQVIPAQITTVEDKIAGNLSFTQLLLLMAPIFSGAFAYALLPPTMKLVWYKLLIFTLLVAVCTTLALRIKGMLVLNWLLIISRFALRPKYYVFDKNESFARDMDLVTAQVKLDEALNTAKAKKSEKVTAPVAISDAAYFENILQNNKLALRFTTNKKGGLDVGLD